MVIFGPPMTQDLVQLTQWPQEMNQGYVLLNKSDKTNVYFCLSRESTPGFMHLAPGLPQRHAVLEPMFQPTLKAEYVICLLKAIFFQK